MNLNITKRDIKFFILGMITLIVLQFAFDFNHNIEDIKRGFNDGWKAAEHK